MRGEQKELKFKIPSCKFEILNAVLYSLQRLSLQLPEGPVMEFTCLWSKDAQQKKRKRWTDGIARFSSATGVLSVWDQVCPRMIFTSLYSV